MVQYIYFVKCPNCEDEHFDFFDEAKEFALGCLSKKPIITQTEVNRNDFGECTDHCDLGTIWSWEDTMTADEPAASVFTRDALKTLDKDPEFDALDNSLEDIPDNFRKPIPEGMTIEQLVEEMEENEDEVECVCCQELHPKEDCQHDDKHGWICDDCKDEVVECTWCEELYDRSECRYEVDLGWLCDRCEAAIKSRGETLTFREGSYWDFLDEDFDAKKMETLVYDKLTVPVQTGYVPATREEPEEYITKDYTDSFEYSVPANDVATTIYENFLTDEEYYELAESEDNDKLAWKNFLSRYDEFVEKYSDELLDYYKEDAEEAAKDDFQDRYDDRGFDEGYTKSDSLKESGQPCWFGWYLSALDKTKKFFYMNKEATSMDPDEASKIMENSIPEPFTKFVFSGSIDAMNAESEGYTLVECKYKSMLEELEDPDTYRFRLADCPECGASRSYDHETGICIGCGFNFN